MESLRRARVNRLETLKKFLLSQAIKIWRIKITRSVEDFLNHIEDFMKLMKAGAKKKTNPGIKNFLLNMNHKIAPDYYCKSLKNCLNLYDRCQRMLKCRVFHSWRNKVHNTNNQLTILNQM